MNNDYEIVILKKMIKKELLKELYAKGLFEFSNINNIIKKIDEDIIKIKNMQNEVKDLKNITIKVLL